MLRFEAHGIGYAHLTLPADKYKGETEALEKAAANLRHCLEHHVYYLTGHSDVMLAIRLKDFRSAFHFDYGSEATGTNWLFGVPYVPSLYQQPKPERLALTYVVHLRVVRDLFRKAGAAAEEEIVSAIQRLLGDDVRGEVLAGFGWSDLMVAGTFETVDSIISAVKGIQKVEVDGRPAIRRVLTILGYAATEMATKPSDMKVRPVILARAAPSRIVEVALMLRDAIDPDKPQTGRYAEWTATSVDGKWDVVLAATDGEALPLADFIRLHRHLAESNKFQEMGLERLETHLLTTDVWKAAGEKSLVPDEFQGHRCSCEKATPTMSRQLSDLLSKVKPKHLEAAIRNVLGLFRAASKDPLNCCELSATLKRCELGLKLLLQNRAEVVAEMEATAAIDGSGRWKAADAWYHGFNQAQINVQDWCTYAEKVVSQRTVGRFEEFLSQNERVVSYRGGVQKLLYLADALLNSYAAKFEPEADKRLPLVCLFDPVDIVLSHRYAGMVRMPSRFLFVLPVAINHLWHEVGEYAYFQKLPSVRDKVITDRRHQVRQSNIPEYAGDVGDVYADAMTFLYGYRGHLDSFMLATAYALFETPSLRFAPSVIKDRFLLYLLLRLYLACECASRALLKFDPPTAAGSDTWDAWEPKAGFIETSIRNVAGFLRDELLRHRRFHWIEIREQLVEQAINNIQQTVAHGFRPFLVTVVRELKTPPGEISPTTKAAFKEITDGNLVDFVAVNADIDDVFHLMQIRMIEELRRTEAGTPYGGSFFQETAALMRSSILSFYKLEKVPACEADQALEGLLADD